MSTSNDEQSPECITDAYSTDLALEDGPEHTDWLHIETGEDTTTFRAQTSRAGRKAQRQSRPAMILAAMDSSARALYTIAQPGTTDLSYASSRRSARNSIRHLKDTSSRRAENPLPEPVSLYSVLTRYLEHHTLVPSAELDFHYSQVELRLLESKRYTPDSVVNWVSCLNEPRSKVAAQLFEPGRELPPLFMLLLYLRRKHIRVSALGIVMRHINRRLKLEFISWNILILLVVRLLRHARDLWPESMPWIASLFTTEATRLFDNEGDPKLHSQRTISNVTWFCNKLLLLLSLPSGSHPLLAAQFQENAQFQVLQYMASNSPAIVVSKLGFRSVTRNQLAHSKTSTEKEWAELKGPSWPPWKESRTAMDEDKGYQFGASRASKILHRMYEAGYEPRQWEIIAQVYAGWDVDLSPTIQTRTSIPGFSAEYNDVPRLQALLKASRIRTTRTRREAWACFLSQEATNHSGRQEMYLAMFEKLYYLEAERASYRDFSSEPNSESDEPTPNLLPGDMKEVLSDPTSPLHNVFLSEPLPSYVQLCHRMRKSHVKPSNRLLAFLLETCPDFQSGLSIIRMACDGPDCVLSRLVAGVQNDDSPQLALSGYLFAAFIRLLCRFGRYEKPPATKPTFLSPSEHARRFRQSRQYLLEYAYALLSHYQPQYRPAWTVYITKMVQHRGTEQAGNMIRYRIICELVERMERVDLDVDDETFRLVCTATYYAGQTTNQGLASIEDARHLHSTGSPRLRTLFTSLVGANAQARSSSSMQGNDKPIPPHIPGPAELHSYVRVLGMLRDYEGLYSFSTWLTKHHAEVTARAEARHSGSKLLFRTLVSLRAAVDGGAPDDITQLIKAQIEGVEEWGGWPAQEYVELYQKGHLKSAVPGVGGR